jgi:hypothetical protein
VVETQKQWSRWSFGSFDTTTYWLRYRQDRAGLYEADVFASDPPGPGGAGAAADREMVQPAGPKFSAQLSASGLSLTAAQAAAYDAAMARIQQKLEIVAQAQAWHGHVRRPPHGHRGGVLDHELTRLKYPLHTGQGWTIREEPLFTSRVVGFDVLKLRAGRLGGWKIRIESVFLDPEDKVYLWYGRSGFLKQSVSIQGVALDEWGNRVGTTYWQESTELESYELLRP